jgi:chemotaxis protein CheY-P-specific phosphatase CheC
MTLKRAELAQYAEACALRAGSVLAALLDRELVPEAPWIQSTPLAGLGACLRPEERPAAVIAELEGAAQGRMALLVSESAREAVHSLVDRRSVPRSPRRTPPPGAGAELMAASALLEMGNIAFSAAANALADAVGGRVFPSVPRFSNDPIDDLCEGWPRDAEALVIQFELVSPRGALRVGMVWLPQLDSAE